MFNYDAPGTLQEDFFGLPNESEQKVQRDKESNTTC